MISGRAEKRWIVWFLGLVVLVTAIVLNFSRAGILILVAGSAFWLGAFVLRRGSAARIALGLSVLLVLLTAMLIFGGQTFDRFNLRSGPGADVTTDLRWSIFQDALQLIRASPWCGIGLGNFDAVFAVFRDASLTAARTIHPESDWFWLWVEMGWPVVLLVIAGIALLVRRVFPLQEGTNQRFRVAALIAALLFALHGLVDVSGHRVGTAFSGLFFLGMALRRPMELRASAWPPRLFRLLGLLFLVCGIAWLVAARYRKVSSRGQGAENEMRKAAAASQGRNFRRNNSTHDPRSRMGAAQVAALLFPRSRQGRRETAAAEVLDDFRRARFLEPNV